MANLVRPRGWGLVKPPTGSQIDWGHPLAHGLTICIPFNEWGGLPRNIVNGMPLSESGGGSYAWRGSPRGGGLRAINNTTRFPIGTEGTNLRLPTASCTIAIGKDHITSASGSTFGTGGGSLDGYVPYIDSTVYWDFGGQAGSNRLSVGSLPNLVGDNDWAFVAGRRGSSIWQNGVLRTSQSTAITRTAGTSTFELSHGNTSGDAQTFRYFYLWERELTGSEIQWLAAEPYAFFAPPGPKILYINLAPFTESVPTDCGIGLESGDYLQLEDGGALGVEACNPTDADTGTGDDAGESIAATLTDAETATGADAGESVAATLTDAETATGAEAASIAAASSDADTGTGTDAEATLAVATTDPETATAADAGESLAAASTDAETASAVDAEAVTVATTDPETGAVTETEAIAATISDTESGTASETEAVGVAFSDADTATSSDAGESIAASLADAETGSGADAGEALSVQVSDSDTGTAVEAELMGVTLTDDDLAVIAEAEAIVAAVLDADDGTGDEAGTIVELAVGDPGCMTLTITDYGEMTLALSTLGDATVSIADDPHTLTLTISDAHIMTLALATLATLTLTIEECDDAITPDTGEARVTVTGEERVTTGDETRVIA